MSGYTPVFSDIYTGTLYGQWPAAAVWATLLPLFNSRGELDISFQALSGMTGWPIDLLREGIEQLSNPDSGSRSKIHDGRRLIPIAPDRDWGWIAVNHAQYAAKARKSAYNERQVESGANAERLKARREAEQDRVGPDETSQDRTRPDETGQNRPPTPTPTPTPTKTKTETDTRAAREPTVKASRGTRLPDDFELTAELRAFATQCNLAPERTFGKFCDYWRGKPGKDGTKLDWVATWRNWCRSEQERLPGFRPQTARVAKSADELEAEFNQRQLAGGAHAGL